MKINIRNKKKVNAAIEEVQGKASSRTLDIKLAEKKLKYLKLPKKQWPGLRITVGCDEKFPDAYRYAAMATYADIVRTQTTWQIVDICREDAKRRAVSVRMTFTEEQRKHLIEHLIVEAAMI